MKRIIAFLLLAATVVAVAGCKDKSTQKDGEKTKMERMIYNIELSEKQWNEYFDEETCAKAMGEYDYETRKWTPLSDSVFLFDFEVFDIEHMYTLFLQGVQSIANDITITDIVEDLSGMTEEMTANPLGIPTDGTRSVSFKINGHDYSATLESRGDWCNEKIIGIINSALEKENTPNRLWTVNYGIDQLVTFVYGTEESLKARFGLN